MIFRSNFTHIKYNNFPQHYLQEVFDMSVDYLPDGFLDVDAEDVDEDLVLMMQGSKVGKYTINIENILFALNVYVSHPAKKMFDVHKDRNRNIGLNFPIQVDPEKGYLLVMKDENYNALGECVEEPSKIKWDGKLISNSLPGHRKWPYAKEEDMQKVRFDCPIMLNTSRPHSYVNYSNKFRIIASLNSKKDPAKIHRHLKGFL